MPLVTHSTWTLRSNWVSAEAKETAVVVLPVPPLKMEMEITFAIVVGAYGRPDVGTAGRTVLVYLG